MIAPKLKPEHVAAALRAIADSEDAPQLGRMMVNARARGANAVYDAAFARRLTLLADDEPGSVAHDFWKTIHAFEQLLSEERGKATRLTRTRQKLKRVGVMKTLEDFASAPDATEGFDMLIARSMPALTGEAIMLRHSADFPEEAVSAARARLEGAGVDVSDLPVN